MDLDIIPRTGKKGLVYIRFTKFSCALTCLCRPQSTNTTSPLATDLAEQSGLNKKIMLGHYHGTKAKWMVGRTGFLIPRTYCHDDPILYFTIQHESSFQPNHHVHVLPEH
jgi:hypothetical protein